MPALQEIDHSRVKQQERRPECHVECSRIHFNSSKGAPGGRWPGRKNDTFRQYVRGEAVSEVKSSCQDVRDTVALSLRPIVLGLITYG